ncbi:MULTISPECIES: PAS domain S-box protein [Bacillaceae]|uniref:PAS domain-containing sensor histidine kinase n=1 Tax=Bacillaceae TaxID=186817 RepID=UPI00273FE961|nr:MULTISPECIES: PAS domain S-box protein [Bacillus]MDT0159145.1 PAS domain S-box protein [Bacillus sp. AG4(2022)]MDW2878555.1 PAS domain S-box protein [Bacillus infantis]
MKNSNMFMQLFYQSRIPQTVVIGHIDQVIVNEAFCKFLGYSMEEWAGLTIEDISHPDDYKKDLELLNEILDGKRTEYELEKRYICKDGSHKTGQLNLSLVKGESADDQYMFGQIVDITEQKRLESKREESEQNYRLLADNISDLIILHKYDATYLYASPSVNRILGYEPDEMLELNAFKLIHPDDIEEVRRRYQLMLRIGEPLLITHRVKKKDGSYIWMESHVKGIDEYTFESGAQILSVSRDIQQRIETNELLRRSEKLAVVGQMAAAVAHEIRNPLTPIKGFMQLFSDGRSFNPAFSSIIINEINRIDNIITEFLALAKPHSTKVEVLDLNDVIRHVVDLMMPQALMNNKELTFEPGNGPYPLLGDPNSLKQLFINIIQNALDAIEEKGSSIISTVKADGELCAIIKDSGCGIPAERLANLGEPFYSTKEKGTGLGLMTSYKIADDHHGRVKVESDEGKGTTVRVYFPVHGM